MLLVSELPKHGINAVTRVNGDIGVDQVGHDIISVLFAAFWDFDWLLFFNMRRFRHAPQRGNGMLETVSRRESRLDVLAVSRLGNAGSWHWNSGLSLLAGASSCMARAVIYVTCVGSDIYDIYARTRKINRVTSITYP